MNRKSLQRHENNTSHNKSSIHKQLSSVGGSSSRNAATWDMTGGETSPVFPSRSKSGEIGWCDERNFEQMKTRSNLTS
jgi:hypothetical protein